MKVVKFVQNYTPYTEGDIASFEDREADEMIKAGVAVKYGKTEVVVETEAIEKPAVDKMVVSPKVKK